MSTTAQPPDDGRKRLLLKLLAGLVIAGVFIGLIVGVLGTTVLRSLGLKEQPPPAHSQAKSDDPLPILAGHDDDNDSSDPADNQSDQQSDQHANATKRPGMRPHGAVLHVRPVHAQPGEKVSMTGRFRGLHGGTVQVQRREHGRWTNFPVTATLEPDGRFETYIITSRTGSYPFRVTQLASGHSTPPVRITIG